MGVYCEDCHWDVDSNGHLRECVRPKQEAEESARAAKLESDLANALLQNEEMRHLVDAAVALYHDSAGHHEEAAWNEFVSQVRAYEIGKKEKRNDETFQGRNNDDGIMG